MRTPEPAHGTIEEVIAEVLGIPVASVVDDLGFRSIPEWDSIRHVELMLALEEHLGLEIDADRIVDLTTVRAIRSFADRPRVGVAVPASEPLVHRGLSGVHVDETRISEIDGGRGWLAYRGYAIDELAEHSTFEETAFLLLYGELPTARELRSFQDRLAERRELPSTAVDVAGSLREAHPVVALRTAVSALAASAADASDDEDAVALIARVPAILAAHRGNSAADESSHGGFVFRALTGRSPDDPELRTLDRILILLAEHGSNASAFAGRVAVGTGADLHAAVTAAIATFAGPLHGGAIEGVAEMIAEIGEPSAAAAHVRALRERQEPVLGLGHRLYTTEDPRAGLLREILHELGEEGGDLRSFEILEEVRAAMRPYSRFGVDVNVDFYAGAALTLLGIPADRLTAAFACARIAGWVAHAAEQRRNNVLIRPLLRFAGADARSYPRSRISRR